MAFICAVDQIEFDDLEALHYHLRYDLKVSQKDYYLKYVAKKDLLTGKPLPFKSPEHYLNHDFTDKNNLREYLKKNREEGQKWAIDWLKKRVESKCLEWTPTQVELRSLPCPTIPYYDFIGGYDKICADLNLKPRFSEKRPLQFIPLPKKAKIIIDTREQLELDIKGYEIIKKALNVGDYGLEEPYDKKVYVERKSLLDLIGTVTKDLGRFQRELDRAVESNSYVVMVVEEPLHLCLEFKTSVFLQKKYVGLRYVQTNPEHVFHNLRETLQKYALNFQVLFANGRREATNAVIKLFELGDQVKYVDLQLALENKELVLL